MECAITPPQRIRGRFVRSQTHSPNTPHTPHTATHSTAIDVHGHYHWHCMYAPSPAHPSRPARLSSNSFLALSLLHSLFIVLFFLIYFLLHITHICCPFELSLPANPLFVLCFSCDIFDGIARNGIPYFCFVACG